MKPRRHVSADIPLPTRQRGRPAFLAPIQPDAPAQTRPHSPLNERFALTVEEAAEYVGVCGKTIRDAIGRDDVLAHKVGRKLLIAREEVERWFLALPTTAAA